MTEPRMITLPTADHGPVTLDEPAWCIGHPNHRPDDRRADILHTGPDVALVFQGRDIGDASLVESPYAELPGGALGVSVSLLGRTLDPVHLYGFAASLDTYADRLRDLADQLTALLAGGGQ
ncbi:hypothetical protein RB628_03590 [Streptomyces sp. ADMS]|uniref:DUF6907 domain-containing protein n=1 Tax=Streptomyces sp. ADMS TaxID=3071415 RepID=UPI00296F8D79|nr:hypothetical protein [Streptomyces sp. ADMS]MDW4904443.1 hypothetical protein [Streptomyces sp. ADMS]